MYHKLRRIKGPVFIYLLIWTQKSNFDTNYQVSRYQTRGITAVSSSYLVLDGTWYNRSTTPLLLHTSNALWLSYACGARGGARSGAPLRACQWYVYTGDLEHCMPRLAPHNITTTYITMYKCVFLHIGISFSSGRGSFLVLSAPGNAGSPPEQWGASVGPGRGPWHVLWGFKVESKHGEAFRARRAIQVHTNPRTS